MRYLILLAVVMCILSSCAPRQKLIAHGWKFDDIEVEGTQDSSGRAFTALVRKQMRSNVLFSMEGDSSYVIRQLKEGRATRGKWWFSPDKKLLYTQTEFGMNTYQILKLTKKVLIYKTTDPVSHQTARIICTPKD